MRMAVCQMTPVEEKHRTKRSTGQWGCPVQWELLCALLPLFWVVRREALHDQHVPPSDRTTIATATKVGQFSVPSRRKIAEAMMEWRIVGVWKNYWMCGKCCIVNQVTPISLRQTQIFIACCLELGLSLVSDRFHCLTVLWIWGGLKATMLLRQDGLHNGRRYNAPMLVTICLQKKCQHGMKTQRHLGSPVLILLDLWLSSLLSNAFVPLILPTGNPVAWWSYGTLLFVLINGLCVQHMLAMVVESRDAYMCNKTYLTGQTNGCLLQLLVSMIFLKCCCRFSWNLTRVIWNAIG